MADDLMKNVSTALGSLCGNSSNPRKFHGGFDTEVASPTNLLRFAHFRRCHGTRWTRHAKLSCTQQQRADESNSKTRDTQQQQAKESNSKTRGKT